MPDVRSFSPSFPPTVLWFEDRVVEVPLPRAFARPHEPLSLVEHRFTDTALVLDQASRRSLRPHCGLAPGNTLDSTSRLHAMFHLHVHYVRMQCFTCIRILRWLRERILKADPTISNQRIRRATSAKDCLRRSSATHHTSTTKMSTGCF